MMTFLMGILIGCLIGEVIFGCMVLWFPEKLLWKRTQMIDTHSQSVEIRIAQHPDGIRVWVDVDGKCALRVYRVPFDKFVLDDMRPKPEALEYDAPEPI